RETGAKRAREHLRVKRQDSGAESHGRRLEPIAAQLQSVRTPARHPLHVRPQRWPLRPELAANLRLAGAAGFEPANAGTKNRCLTTWRRPSIGAHRRESGAYNRRADFWKTQLG